MWQVATFIYEIKLEQLERLRSNRKYKDYVYGRC